MPRTRPENFKGVKGKSGRKSAREELNKIRAIASAWKRVADNVEKADVEKIALPIALKDMTTKQEVSGSLIVQQITGMKIMKDDN